MQVQSSVQSPEPKDLWISVQCKICLETLLNAQPIFKWYAETKFDKAKEANSAAVMLFKTQRYLDAFHKFHLALTLLTYVVEEERAKEVSQNRMQQR